MASVDLSLPATTARNKWFDYRIRLNGFIDEKFASIVPDSALYVQTPLHQSLCRLISNSRNIQRMLKCGGRRQ
jgi:hypothetical protein